MRQTIIITVLTIALTISILIITPNGAVQEITQFKVLWQDKSFLSILVPPKTTNEQLKALIYEFRKARKGNFLSKWFSPTTPGLSNKYALIYIYVFSESEWATKDKLDRYYTLSVDQRFSMEYVKHIRALYYCDFLNSSKEEGSLGDTNGVARSPFYKKLF